MLRIVGLLGVASLVIAPLAAQDAPAPTESENSIVVTAQRSGAPMWIVETTTGTVILVGEIRAIPKTTPWEPARLEALAAAHEEDYSRQSFLLTSFGMLREELRFNRDTADDASNVVKKAAEKADVAITRAATLRGEDVIDNLFEAPPTAHIPCLVAAMDAVEAGPQIVEERATNWRRFKIPAVMNNPLESALGQCWPWADETLGSELRTIWVDRIAEASAAKGTTLAVVPLRVLAESGGVLDQLEQRGFDIAGPPWK